jgi:hypothetical protein
LRIHCFGGAHLAEQLLRPVLVQQRRYSTTFGVLRRARVAFAKRRRARDGIPLDAWSRPEDGQAAIVTASWVYVGAGHETEGERWLALSAAARAREHRRIAREALTTTTRSAADPPHAKGGHPSWTRCY